MKMIHRLLGFTIMGLLLVACSNEEKKSSALEFDSVLWQKQEKGVYPFRRAMLDSVLYSDTIRSLTEKELLQQLGAPTKKNEGYLYYTISESKAGLFTLHQSSLVVKLDSLGSVEWIKLHE